MAGRDRINHTGVVSCFFLSKDTYPEIFKNNKILKKERLFMKYPSELLIGDQDKETNPLVKYFEAKKWKYSWDFDKKTKVYWYDVYSEDKIVLQVEFGETVEEMIKAIRTLIPALKEVEDFDENAPDIMKKHLKNISSKTCVYVGDWDGK